MKKTVTYVAMAILLGFAVVTLPKALGPQQATTSTPTTDTRNQPNYFGLESSQEGIIGLASQPNNLPPIALILLTGIIAAIGVYTIFKRRMTTQPTI